MATEVTVPMVGKIVNVLVKVGEKVAEDDQIATLEAMKMETNITAPVAGKISKINVNAGDGVQAGLILVEFE